MELNTEINKVFGTEMAKIFAATISEEEMAEKARTLWVDLNKPTNEWGRRVDTALEAEVKRVLLDSLHKRVYEILQEPENEEMFEETAREMVTKARQIAEEGIVKHLAANIVGRTVSSYNDYSDIITRVMNEIHIEQDRTRHY